MLIPATRTRKGGIELATFLSGKHVRQSIFVVIPARIELATYRLGGGCSILLSYGTITTAQAELKPFRPSCIKYYTAKTKYWQ